MPNCDYYATPEDHAQVLGWLFEQGECRVFELASDFEKPLTEFHTADEVCAQFDRVYSTGRKWDTVHLQLWVAGASPRFRPRRVRLDPKACDGATFRYLAEGWGLVQLYLGGITSAGLTHSHTNHNTLTRAKAWSLDAAHELARWDFKKITSFSSRLNRYLEKLSVAKLNSRPVLPGAQQFRQTGETLLPR